MKLSNDCHKQQQSDANAKKVSAESARVCHRLCTTYARLMRLEADAEVANSGRWNDRVLREPREKCLNGVTRPMDSQRMVRTSPGARAYSTTDPPQSTGTNTPVTNHATHYHSKSSLSTSNAPTATAFASPTPSAPNLVPSPHNWQSISSTSTSQTMTQRAWSKRGIDWTNGMSRTGGKDASPSPPQRLRRQTRLQRRGVWTWLR